MLMTSLEFAFWDEEKKKDEKILALLAIDMRIRARKWNENHKSFGWNEADVRSGWVLEV